MSMANQNEAWVILNVADDMKFVAGQGAVAAKRVTFRTYTGITSDVLIADTEFNADTVSEIVNNAAAQIMSVQALKGPSLADVVQTYDPETGQFVQSG